MNLSQLPPELKLQAYQEAVRREYKDSLFKTAKYLLGFKDITKRTHGDMIEALEAKTTRKLIVMPRGTFKSSISSVAYPIWCLIRDPNTRILLDSEVYTNSKNFLREIRTHLQSELFISLFGNWKSDTWNESELTVAPRTRPLKEASITCSGVGAVKVGQHYNIIIADDLNSQNNSLTPEGCEKIITHYRMGLAILEPGGTYVVVGTRYNQNDLIGHIIEHEIERKGLL